MELHVVRVEKPDDVNVIIGHAHFIKTVEDLHEALVTAVPGIKFGVAFCEASGKTLIRWSGTDKEMTELAQAIAQALNAGHTFVITLAPGYYPINVLNWIKMVPEVARIHTATANPLEIIIAETDQGRGILGVIDGYPTKGVEGEEDIKERVSFLRRIGYKLGLE
ncbi:MAG: hypothetical protein GXO55_09115 [Chloroflexi bacterium]|nr:hypothetical protein [Chloroflexota bacterium]